jgi:hypothetical protein
MKAHERAPADVNRIIEVFDAAVVAAIAIVHSTSKTGRSEYIMILLSILKASADVSCHLCNVMFK